MFQHELIGKSVLIVWAPQYEFLGAKTDVYEVLDLDQGLLKVQKGEGTDENTDLGSPFWIPLSSISFITEG